MALSGRHVSRRTLRCTRSSKRDTLTTILREQRDQIFIFQEMVKRNIPCLVLTRNYHATHAMMAVASEMNLPIFRTPLITMNFVNLATIKFSFAKGKPLSNPSNKGGLIGRSLTLSEHM